MPQRVGRHLALEPGGGGVSLEDLPAALARQPSPSVIEEYGRRRAFDAVGEKLRPAHSEVVADRPTRRSPDGDRAGLAPLSRPDEDRAAVEIEIVDIECDEL